MRRVFRDDAPEAALQELGYVIVPLLADEQVAQLRRLHEETTAGREDAFYTSLWSADVDYRRRVALEIQGVLGAALEKFLDDYRVCLGNFAVKAPGQDASRVPMHQDWTMTDESRFPALTVWCPLIDVDPVNGALGIVPGSHRFVENLRPNGPIDKNYSPYAEVDRVLWDKYLREVPMRAGEALIYNGRCLHASHPNRSEQMRVAAVSVAVPREARLMHFFRHSPVEVEAFLVDEEFYWRDVELGKSPTAGQSLGRFASVIAPFDEEQLAKRVVEVGEVDRSPRLLAPRGECAS